MLISMTGYGKAENNCGTKKIVVEVRSLNSKQLDLGVKIPYAFREMEMELRSVVAKELGRGKVDLTIYTEDSADSLATPINEDIFVAYYKQLESITSKNGIDLKGEPIAQAILRLPDVLRANKNEVDDEQKEMMRRAVNDAVNQLVAFRKQEGIALEKDLMLRVSLITDYLKQVEPFEQNRIAMLRQRLADNLKGISSDVKFDKDRFEQEIIYYLEKLDITEEKVRLKNHCKYFIETSNQPEPAGRKLGFIAQEMGREINTLGSKASDTDIQKLVVKMKDELEKIKEQVLNVL